LSTENFASSTSRFDLVEYLAVSGNSGAFDTFVISAEFKDAKGVIDAELLITGYVSDPNSADQFPRHLVPLVTVQVPLGVSPRSNESNPGFGVYSEEFGVSRLRELYPALTEIARMAQKSAGLVEASLTIRIPDAASKIAENVRDIRQNRKARLAIEHLKLHWAKRPEREMEYVQVGKYAAPQSLVYFSQLYSLARGIGVKEVRPRIQQESFYLQALADYRRDGLYNKDRPRNPNRLKTDKSKKARNSHAYDFAEMVAKLKRANYLLQRP
jgi:hypothetical protein